MPRHGKPRVHGADHTAGVDPSQTLYAKVGGEAGPNGVIPFSVFGTLQTQSGQLRWYAPSAGTLVSVHLSVGTAPAGSGVTVRVNRNGSSIGSATIPAGGHTQTFVPSPADYTAGDYFTVDITAIGSSTAGSDLVVQLRG